jgi:hypothetical protein
MTAMIRPALLGAALVQMASAWIGYCAWPGWSPWDAAPLRQAGGAFHWYSAKGMRGALTDMARSVDHLTRTERKQAKATRTAGDGGARTVPRLRCHRW